jgi:hypothetical protein
MTVHLFPDRMTAKAGRSTVSLFTLGEAAALLGKEPAWLGRFVTRNPVEEDGAPYFVRLGRFRRFSSEAIRRLELAIKDYDGRRVFLYFFELEGQGAIKIGIAEDWHARMLNLRSASPYRLRRLLVLNFFAGFEKPMHRRFKAQHIRGEWFRDSPEIREFISSCRDHELFVIGEEK